MTRDVPDSCVSSSRYPWSSVYWYILGAQTIPVGIINPSSALGGLRLCTIHSHLMSPCLAHRKHLVRMWCGRCAEGKPLMASLLGIVFAASFKASLGAELETWIYTFHTIRKRQQCVRAWETHAVTVLHSQSSILNGVIHSFLVLPCCLPDLNSPVRGWTHTPCCGRQSPKHWAARESPSI